ncbi:MAG: RNA polymerase factor sigma-32 [Acidobacteriota bacterium]|nr:MAG: RNA polymerase factor sigma-32 [Acidobacteriota bacterium]
MARRSNRRKRGETPTANGAPPARIAREESQRIDVDGDDDAEVIELDDHDAESEFVELPPGDEEQHEDDSELALVPVRERPLPSAIDPLSRYIQEVKRFPELDPDEERELARRYRETGDPEIAARLITANLQLVVKLALMYRRALRNVMDLIQEGNLGLMEALRRYDPEQGVRLSTYASWWIKAYILKFLLDNARLVRVGTTNARRKLLYNLRREQRKLEARGVVPTTKLLAARFGVSEQDVEDVDQALSAHDLSVDMPVSEEGSSTVADLMAAPMPSAEQQVADAEMREKVDRAIDQFRKDLDERDRAILDRRLVADEPLTLQQLGDQYGVTREAMRQAEAKLKKRLAAFLESELGEEVILRFAAE